MANPFVAEIRIFGCNFAPLGWAFCDGQLMPIFQNTALFSLLGTTYGGNGTTTFALPNLQGSFPMGFGQGPGLSSRNLGEAGGEATHTLTLAETPRHSHPVPTAASATTEVPDGEAFAPAVTGAGFTSPANLYRPPTVPVAMAAEAIQPAGSGFPHENRQPYLALNFCIALQGIFPPRA